VKLVGRVHFACLSPSAASVPAAVAIPTPALSAVDQNRAPLPSSRNLGKTAYGRQESRTSKNWS